MKRLNVLIKKQWILIFHFIWRTKVCSCSFCIRENCCNADGFWTRMIAVTLPIFSYPFQGSSGSKSKLTVLLYVRYGPLEC